MSDESRVAVTLSVNGVARRLDVSAGETLLRTLRSRLGLTGAKEGCVEGECGACTVLVDGSPVDSCLLATAALEGKSVLTVEGLAPDDALSPLQQAFVEHGAVQCGFCTPGFLMTLTALLNTNDSPTASEVRDALAGNICRCTGYRQMLDAVAAAVGTEEGGT